MDRDDELAARLEPHDPFQPKANWPWSDHYIYQITIRPTDDTAESYTDQVHDLVRQFTEDLPLLHTDAMCALAARKIGDAVFVTCLAPNPGFNRFETLLDVRLIEPIKEMGWCCDVDVVEAKGELSILSPLNITWQ